VAKTSGLAWTTLSVDDSAGSATDIRNDVTDLQIATPRAVQDTTGVDKSAHERLLLLADFSATMNGVFNPTGAHLVFRTVPSTSVARTMTLTVSGVTLAPEVLLTDYQLKRGNGGELTYSVPAVLANGTVPTWT
jgi:hypothetical protein